MASTRQLLLVFTDSRGKNLDAYIDHCDILVKAYKGATLLQIINYAEPVIQEYHPALVLFIGGTCDLTILNRSTRKISLRHINLGDLLDHMIEVFSEARRQVTSKFPGIKIAFGGLCGIDLDRYNGLTSFSNLQPIIDDTVHLLNYQIKTDNVANGLVHPTLTSKIHIVRSRMPRRRNQYRLLTDGVHLSENLYLDWARNIRRFYLNNLP